MTNSFVLNLAVLCSLVPITLLPWRRGGRRDAVFWGLLVLAVVFPLWWCLNQLSGSWRTNLSTDLWVAITASLVLFASVSAVYSQAWRLTPILLPYLMILGLLAALFAYAPGQPLSAAAPTALVDAHILMAVIVVGLLTVAASAALATFLQARALKTKRPNALSRILPPVSDSERLFERLLLLCELVLALGVATGMATQYAETGRLFRAAHMTEFALAAFVVIGLLLIGRRVCGVRGQIAARVVIVAYMLVIVGFFGMKFVHQVLLA
jgi:ABC-type uncharacterized transport system permease subunit